MWGFSVHQSFTYFQKFTMYVLTLEYPTLYVDLVHSDPGLHPGSGALNQLETSRVCFRSAQLLLATNCEVLSLAMTS